MIDAREFAESWRTAWNEHDPDRIAEHYSDDVVYSSPFVARLAGNRDGRLVGKGALRAYITSALDRYLDLYFDEPLHVGAGAGSVCIVYRSVDDKLALETFQLDDEGKARLVLCH